MECLKSPKWKNRRKISNLGSFENRIELGIRLDLKLIRRSLVRAQVEEPKTSMTSSPYAKSAGAFFFSSLKNPGLAQKRIITRKQALIFCHLAQVHLVTIARSSPSRLETTR